MKTFLVVLVLAVAGWAVWSYVVGPAVQSQVAPPLPTATARPPAATPTPPLSDQAVAVGKVAGDFLAAWQGGRYDDMYDLLSPGARSAITATAFVNRYKTIFGVASISSVTPRVMSASIDGYRATVTYTVAMSSTAVGPIHYAATMPLHYDSGRWSVGWTPNLIFPGLGSNYLVHLYPETATRGAIVDRLGQPLAVEGSVLQVGVVPQYITDEKSLLAFLSGWLRKPAATIRAMYHVSWAQQNPSEFVPIGTVTSLQWNAIPPAQQQALGNNGLDIRPGASRRIYPRGTLAAPLLGYVPATDSHGRAGLEAWADPYLAGRDGAKLAIATAPDYAYAVSTIKEQPKQDGATVHLTLDSTLQAAAEKALAGKVGAVVALRPSDGAVLAMASVPGFDPNGFATGLTEEQYRALLNSPHQPLINRAATGQYPLGSIFKIVTMGAALEKMGFTTSTTRFCAGIWTGLGAAYAKRDWLPQGHGNISLHEALVQSCDIYFYQVGLELNQKDPYLLPDYARKWGFGAPTGIVGVTEAAGNIPDPRWTLTALGQPWVPGYAVDMAIGQGFVLVTPLQVAQMLAAVGDNGVLHQPYVVSRITAPGGKVIRDYPPVVKGRLPITAAHLQEILDAMHGVTTETYGTAADKFAGFPWSVAGKTGTAQASSGQPYAWFAAISPVDHPRIALAVMIEQGGEGSAAAAPLARQLLRTFYTQDRDLAGTTKSGANELPVP